MNIGFPLFPAQASTMAPRVDALFFFLVGVSTFFAALICIVIIVFVIKYRRRSDDEWPEEVHGGLWLEVAWTVIPLGLMLVMFFWGAKLFFISRHAPPDSLEVTVVAKQWMWKVQHPEGVSEINELHVPVGRPIKLLLTSQDVIHDFSVPAFRLKQDVLPGRYTTVWFEATKPGSYHLFCDQYCGAQHSGMVGQIIVLPQPQYESWLNSNSTVAPAATSGAAQSQKPGCDTCHGARATGRAPSPIGVLGKPVTRQESRRVTADESDPSESILNPPGKIVAGYHPVALPFPGGIRGDDGLALVGYANSLSREEGEPAQK